MDWLVLGRSFEIKSLRDYFMCAFKNDYYATSGELITLLYFLDWNSY